MSLTGKVIDKYLGDYGFTIWLLPIGCVFFGIIFSTGVYISFIKERFTLEDIAFLFTVITTFLIVSGWFLYQAIISLNIAQEINLLDKDINLVTYFRRKINLSVNEILSITKLDKNSFLLKKHRAVQTEEPCLQIITKDNKRYLITPHMERFDELKAKLTEIVEQNKKTN